MPTEDSLLTKPKPQPMADECNCGLLIKHRHDDVNFGAVVFDSSLKEVPESVKEPVYTEAKRLDTDHFFKDFGPENLCGKPLCSVCCPSAPKENNP